MQTPVRSSVIDYLNCFNSLRFCLAMFRHCCGTACRFCKSLHCHGSHHPRSVLLPKCRRTSPHGKHHQNHDNAALSGERRLRHPVPRGQQRHSGRGVFYGTGERRYCHEACPLLWYAAALRQRCSGGNGCKAGWLALCLCRPHE